jgi:hypothetical protein
MTPWRPEKVARRPLFLRDFAAFGGIVSAMTIWLLALVLVGGAIAAGYAQGAIRATISFFGILTAAMLAMPLSKLMAVVLRPLGVEHPVLMFILAPIIAFIVVLAAFKVIGTFVHKRVDVFYRYKAGDLRLALYERLSHRLGACMGLLNGTAYVILICAVFLPMSYFTRQLYTNPEDHWTIRLLNRVGNDIQSTGLAKAVWRLDQAPADYYRATDFLAFLYNNPLTHGRLALYPAYLRLGEKEEYKRLGEPDYGQLWLSGERQFGNILNDDRSKQLWQNPANLASSWAMLSPDLEDVEAFLRTGKSTKYDREPILGIWHFDPRGALVELKKAKPNLPTTQLKNMRIIYPLLGKANMVVSPDHRVVIRDLLDFGQAGAAMTAAATAAAQPAAVAGGATQPPVATAGGAAGGRLQDARYRMGLSRNPGPGTAPPAYAPAAPAQPGQPAQIPTINLEGEWQPDGSGYVFKFDKFQFKLDLENIRMTIHSEPFPLVFEKDIP